MSRPTLVHVIGGQPVKLGDVVDDFRGEPHTVTGWQEPHKPESTGRIYVKPFPATEDTPEQGYYPSVFDCEWIGRTDRGAL